MLDAEGHQVTVIDSDPEQFRRLGRNFRGQALVGAAIDEEVLRQAGLEQADALAAVTPSDSINIMAAQIAKFIFKVPKVIARIYDPLREETYHALGLETFCPTTLGARTVKELLVGPAAVAGVGKTSSSGG